MHIDKSCQRSVKELAGSRFGVIAFLVFHSCNANLTIFNQHNLSSESSYIFGGFKTACAQQLPRESLQVMIQ